MNLNDIRRISTNRFFCSELLHSFMSGYLKDSETMPFQVMYITLPIIFDANARKKLSKANKNSSFNSLFFKDLSNATSFIRFQDRLDYFKKITNLSLIELIKDKKCFIEFDQILITTEGNNSHNKSEIKEYLRAAYYLGVITSKEKPAQLLLKLGVRKI